MSQASQGGTSSIQLPEPGPFTPMPLPDALLRRRSVRRFGPGPLTLAELSAVLWAAQGVTTAEGLRTAPSAGGLHPLEVQLIVADAEELPDGLYRYQPHDHQLALRIEKDLRQRLSDAAWGQRWVRNAAAVMVFGAVVQRSAVKYKTRALRYTLLEIGHAAQSAFLAANALNLAAVVVGSFKDRQLNRALELPRGERAYYLMPLGRAVG